MRKITEIPIALSRRVMKRDEFGNLVQASENYEVFREVNHISRHFSAYSFIDAFFLFSPLLAFVLLTDPDKLFSGITILVWFIFWPTIIILYQTMTEYFWQRTPGMFLMGCLVIDEYRNKPDFKTTLLRTLANFNPFGTYDDWNHHRIYSERLTQTWVVKKSELEELRQLQEE